MHQKFLLFIFLQKNKGNQKNRKIENYIFIKEQQYSYIKK